MDSLFTNMRGEHGFFDDRNSYASGNRAAATGAFLGLVVGAAYSALGVYQKSLLKAGLGAAIALSAPAGIWFGRAKWIGQQVETKRQLPFQPLSIEAIRKICPECFELVTSVELSPDGIAALRKKVLTSCIEEDKKLDELLKEEKFSDSTIFKHWQTTDVLDQADRVIRRAAVHAELTLLRLQLLARAAEGPVHQRIEGGMAPNEAIGSYVGAQENPDYRPYFTLTSCYHNIRGFYYYHDQTNDDFRMGNQQYRLDLPGDIDEVAADSFYQEGTQQSEWRKLYNGWCDRVKPLLDHFETMKDRKDERYRQWSQPDLVRESFRSNPGMQPT